MALEIEPDAEAVGITEHDGYSEVVKRASCGEDCLHGPYVYHATRERQC